MGDVKTQAALLEWVNTFPLDAKVESLSELSDGFALNQILGDLDKQYFLNDLEKNTSPSKWLSKKQSLERVYKSLLRYIRNHCDGLESLTLENTIDFSAIAEHDDVEETVKLLTILLMAAISGVNRGKYIVTTQELHGAYEIMNIIKKMQDLEEQSAAPSTTAWENARLPSTLTKDVDLAAEEERAALQAEYTALKKRHADYMTRFERLQDNHTLLLEQQEETARQLKALQASNSGDMADYVKNLQNDLQQREDLIASQEQQIEENRIIKERQQKELNSLRHASEKLLALEDQVTELKTTNATLSKKANMADNYQRKLESQSGLEKDNSKLREQIDVYRDNQKFYDRTVEANNKLQASIDEYRKRFNSYELELVEMSNQKKILEEEVRRRDADIDKLTEQKRHDEGFIADLQETIATGGQPSGYPQTPTAPSGAMLTLEQELEDSHEHINHALENSRLKAENQLLKSNTAGTTNANLRNDLLEAEENYKRLTQRFNQLTEDHAISQEQLAAIISTSMGEKDEAVINTRKLYLEASRERDILKNKVAEMTAEITSRDRELLSVKGDLKALGDDELKTLEELKATHELITSSYQNDLLMLQKQHKILTVDNEQQKSHLVEALLAKDKLRQELANSREGKPVESSESNSDAAASREAVNKTMSELEALKEKTEQQQSTLLELQRKLKAAEENSADAQKALIKNVLRENAMMSTAWYDLSSRLQSNHVVLQRRQDAPKSWLNKQRQMVNATPRR